MNALCYKVIFSKRLGALVAVGENATSQGKSASGAGDRSVEVPLSQGGTAGGHFVGTLKVLFASSVMACMATTHSFAAPAANTLPAGYSVNSGNVAVSTAGTNMTIKQNTDKASVNWQSFSIGSGAAVNVVQNSTSSVLLNRVVGNDPSQIFGKLTANGQVILINPNGIVFGKGGSVTASAFTASTFGMSDEDFKKGKYKYDRNGSKAGITVEQGASINTTVPGGYIALISATVNNQGNISTKQGPVILAAGESVALPSTLTNNVGIPLSGKVRLELAPSTINASVENGGTITTEGGQVLMQAAAVADAVASVTHTGTIDTSGAQGGAVDILADHGQIRVSGNITANSTEGTTGGSIIVGREDKTDPVTGKVTTVLAATTDVSGAKLESKGGFVETSGHDLKVDDAQVTAKDWLLDPDNIEITDAATWTAGYSKISAATISAALNTTDVTIKTTGNESGGFDNSAASGDGNILVNAAITKTATTRLTKLSLKADNGITVNQKISSTGAALDVEMTADGLVGGKPVTGTGAMDATERSRSAGVLINNTSINANGGDVTLTGTSYANSTAQNNGIGKGVQIHNGSSITAKNITITGTAENVAGNTSYGVVFQRYPSAQTLNATGDINITGTLNGTGNGSGNGSGVSFKTSDWGAQAPMITAGGKFTLRANNRASTANTSAALDALSGMQVKARGDITVQAETNNAAANAMNFYSGAATVWGNALQGNTSFKSVDGTGAASGNVLIQANQGSIAFNNNVTTSLTNGSFTALTDIKGKNVTIDNTGAGMATGVGALVGSGGTTGAKIGDGSYTTNAATGEITVIKGTGKATSTSVQGVLINDGRSITADKNLNITGASSGNVGIQTGKGALSGGAVNIEGSSDTSIGVYMAGSGGTLSSTVGDVTITGTSASSAVASNTAVNLVNAISANKNVSITGTNTNSANTTAAVYVNAPVTATQGTISITADTAGTSNQALNLNNAAALTTTAGQNITLAADSMNLASNINAGAGTVALQTKGAGVKIDIGNGTDVGSTTASSRTLGLSNAELNKITAGKTIIGDTTTGGNISVTATVNTLDATGNLYLKTAGNVSINNNLTVGTTGGKNFSIEATGTNSTVGGSGIVTANELKIKGSNATVAMAAAANQINTISADVKSLAFKNGKALSVGTVFAGTTDEQSGIKTTGVTSLTGAGSVTQTSAAAISADGLELLGDTADFTLDNASNAVNTIAASTNSVSFTNSKDLVVDQVNNTVGVTTAGATNLKTTQGNLTLKKNITATNNTVSLNIAGSVLRDANVATDGIIKANALKIKANSVGTSTINRVKTETSTLAMDTAGDQYVSEANGVTLAAKTSGGKIDVETLNGTLTVGNVIDVDGANIQGLTTGGAGDISLTGHSTNATGIDVLNTITANGGTATLTGTTDANTRPNNTAYAGIRNASSINAQTIALTGSATDTSADVLGYYGAGGSLIASATLTTTASSAGGGAGFYMYSGTTQSGTGMSITGTSNTGYGIALEGNSQLNNQTSGGLSLIGSTNGAAPYAAILLNRNSITNSNGGVTLTSNSGNIRTANTNAITGSGAIAITAGQNAASTESIDATSLTITQTGNAKTTVRTTGAGNVTTPKVINNGTGDVVIAAGSTKAAGDGSGGQVKTTAGQTITNNAGKTYIYTGNASDTGKLENLMGSLATLYLSKVGDNAQNAQLNTAYANSVTSPLNTIQNGAAAQVMFRENTKFDEIQINPATLTMNAGQVDPSTASFAAAVAAANTNGAALTKASITENKFKISTDAAGIAGTLPTPSNQARTTGTYDYATTSSIANKVTSSISSTPAVKLVVQASNVIPVPTPVVPTSNTTRVKVPAGSANPFALASAESLVDDVCSANSLENCHCEESSVNEGVNICYEPNAGSK
jgi:filamentous hemagglutinin family protein